MKRPTITVPAVFRDLRPFGAFDKLTDWVLRRGWEWPALWLGCIALSRGFTYLFTEERAPYALATYVAGGVVYYASAWLAVGVLAVVCAVTHWRPWLGHWALFTMCEVWASVYISGVFMGRPAGITGALLFGFLGFAAYPAPPIRLIFVPIPAAKIPPDMTVPTTPEGDDPEEWERG